MNRQSPHSAPAETTGAIIRTVSALGSLTISAGRRLFVMLGGMFLLLIETLCVVAGSLSGSRGRESLIFQMVRVGVKAIPIVVLIQLAIGMILPLQMFPKLDEFGQAEQIATINAIAAFRELGPLMTAIVLGGFAGASIAAELGTMVTAEEIEALESLALSPVRFLVVPRVLATVVMMVMLTVIADIVILSTYRRSCQYHRLYHRPDKSSRFWAAYSAHCLLSRLGRQTLAGQRRCRQRYDQYRCLLHCRCHRRRRGIHRDLLRLRLI